MVKTVIQVQLGWLKLLHKSDGQYGDFKSPRCYKVFQIYVKLLDCLKLDFFFKIPLGW